MKWKRILALLMAWVMLFAATACEGIGSEIGNEDLGMEIDPDEINREEDIHLRDKDLLYEMWDPTEVVTMYLTVSYGNEAENTNHTWEEINTYSVYDYDRMGVDRYKVAGLLQVGDENGLIEGELGYGQVAPNCTVQIRGQTSSRGAQKNYKISVKDNKGDWRGQTTIALNKHQNEGLRFRNKLMYDLMAGVDQVMSLRTTFVHLYVKDTTAGPDAQFEDYGLYTQVEQLNKTALKAHGLDKNGHLYKINYFEFYREEDTIVLKDDPRYDLKEFEKLLEVKGDDDHTKLINVLDKINDYTIPIDQILQEHFDVENLTYWMAAQILTGNADTQNRNFYLYSPLNSERWYIIPWDNDAALKRTEYELLERSDFSAWEIGVSNYWGNVFFQRCLKSKMFLEALDLAIEDLREYLSEERINTLAQTYAQIVKPYVYSAPDKTHAPLTPEQYEIVVQSLHDDIEESYQLYLDSLEKPLPFYIGTPYYSENGLTLEWDASYDFDYEPITYTVEVATDCFYQNTIVKEEGIRTPILHMDKLPEGQYFVRVIATNESGHSQGAFDYYHIDSGKVYHTKCFYVDADGQIVEDVYVEG